MNDEETFTDAVKRRLNQKNQKRFGYAIVSVEDEGKWLTNFFKKNKKVAGMAIGGGANKIGGSRRIAFNPYVRNPDGSEFSDIQKEALYKIEAMRHLADEQSRLGKEIKFKITPEMQEWRKKKFSKKDPYYSNDRSFRGTLVSRWLVGDDAPSISSEAKIITQQYEKMLKDRE